MEKTTWEQAEEFAVEVIREGCGGRVGNVVRRFPGWKKLRKQKQKK